MRFPGKLSGIRRAFDWLKEWLGKIREAVTGFDKYTDAARILDKAERSVQDSLGQLFAEGMSEAVRTHDLVGDKKNTAREGGVKYMARDFTAERNLVAFRDFPAIRVAVTNKCTRANLRDMDKERG